MQIIKRREAKAKGLKRYFTGKPCPHGHISERNMSGNCLICKSLRYESDLRKFRGKRRDSFLKKNYGIDTDQYNDMLKEQNYRCMVCNEVETGRARGGGFKCLSVDHCHTSGKIRGLLCSNCNSALGLLNEDRDRIHKLLEYIDNALDIE